MDSKPPFSLLLLLIILMIIVAKCEKEEEDVTSKLLFKNDDESEDDLIRNATAIIFPSKRRRQAGTDLFGLGQGSYYTMHQNSVSLQIRTDGRIGWSSGSPTLYSVFREHSETRRRGSTEHMFTLEAAATQFWICMNGKGRLYTVHRYDYYKMEARRRERRLKKIRHVLKKKIRLRGRLWEELRGASSPFPPSECLFKLYEFTPTESYEHAVGIYSFKHSNSTHGRFLSMNPSTGVPRSYRKPFRHLANHPHLKINQVAISDLRKMVERTRFGRGEAYNTVVRDCTLHLLVGCEKARERREGEQRKGQDAHLHRILERCKKRAMEGKLALPKCSRRRRSKNDGDEVDRSYDQ